MSKKLKFANVVVVAVTEGDQYSCPNSLPVGKSRNSATWTGLFNRSIGAKLMGFAEQNE